MTLSAFALSAAAYTREDNKRGTQAAYSVCERARVRSAGRMDMEVRRAPGNYNHR